MSPRLFGEYPMEKTLTWIETPILGLAQKLPNISMDAIVPEGMRFCADGLLEDRILAGQYQ